MQERLFEQLSPLIQQALSCTGRERAAVMRYVTDNLVQ